VRSTWRARSTNLQRLTWNRKSENSTDYLDTFAKWRKATISFVMSVRPHGPTRLPFDGFSLNILFEYFSKTL
jgi:hypothetical protein